jgi:hypothetical protein
MTQVEVPASTGAGGGDIVARPGKDYRNRRYIMVALLVGAGLWFAYDGYVGWPEHNRKLAEVRRQVDEAERSGDEQAAANARTTLGGMSKEKSPTDMLIQKLLGFTLPPLGIALLVWGLYNSRGEYRLSGTTLHVPGHPPVTFDQITRIDKRLWDRKGIAYIDYNVPGQRAGRLRLDDFVYERKPTDQIFERIERAVAPAPDAATETTNPA